MELRVIQGGAPQKVDKTNRVDRLKMLMGELRTLENVASVMIISSKNIEWKGLTERLESVHQETLDALKFVKQMVRTEFGDDTANELSLVVDNDDEKKR